MRIVYDATRLYINSPPTSPATISLSRPFASSKHMITARPPESLEIKRPLTLKSPPSGTNAGNYNFKRGTCKNCNVKYSISTSRIPQEQQTHAFHSMPATSNDNTYPILHYTYPAWANLEKPSFSTTLLSCHVLHPTRR
ncbi:hypothetical protein BJV77DRAFT_996860 [Russula vinacea]|nr:hypothetical protein BJV77DRAFT_996860 [Russula vinacea]